MRTWLSPAAPTYTSRGCVGRICDRRPTVFALDCVCLDLFLAVRARATVGRPGAANGRPTVLAPNRIGPDLFLAEGLPRRGRAGLSPSATATCAALGLRAWSRAAP